VSESDLERALHQFDRVETNLRRLDDLWLVYEARTLTGMSFGLDDAETDEIRRQFGLFVDVLPSIDGFRPDRDLLAFDDLSQWRMEAFEIGEISAEIAADRAAGKPGRDLAEYRHRFVDARRRLVRRSMDDAIERIDDLLTRATILPATVGHRFESEDGWAQLAGLVSTIDRLLGSGRPQDARWGDLYRHIRFGEPHDLSDIIQMDWPSVRQSIIDHTFEGEPLPVSAVDLSELVSAAPTGSVSTEIKWPVLDPDAFERLIFEIVGSTDGYENPFRPMKTNAPDKGRDLTVDRITSDKLRGTHRDPVLIQCKHYQSKSVTLTDCTTSLEQAKLWPDAGFRVVVMATSGTFTQQAVEWMERHNGSGGFPAVEFWPRSHLERLLASRPAIRMSFGL
jgi:Restriction endonuclease